MTTVWVLTDEVDYEGTTVLGVFTAMTKAKKYCDAYLDVKYYGQWTGDRSQQSRRNRQRASEYVVTKYRVDP